MKLIEINPRLLYNKRIKKRINLMIGAFNGLDFLQTRNNSNGTLTAKGFFECITNIGAGRTFVRSQGELLVKEDAPKRDWWLVGVHVIVLIAGNILSLIALAVREIIRAVDGDYKIETPTDSTHSTPLMKNQHQDPVDKDQHQDLDESEEDVVGPDQYGCFRFKAMTQKRLDKIKEEKGPD